MDISYLGNTDSRFCPTPQASVLFGALRSIDESTLIPSSGILTTTLSTGAQYQILANLLARIDYSHSFLHFAKTSFDDGVDTVSASMNYYIGRNVIVRPSLAYSTRSTNRVGANYDQVQAILTGTLRY